VVIAANLDSVGTERRARSGALSEVVRVVRWYFERAYGAWDGLVPFYCDRETVGWFAVPPRSLAEGTEEAVFRLFVLVSMYQALRDEVIRKRQRGLRRSEVRVLGDLRAVRRAIFKHDCPALASPNAFESDCDVWKDGGAVDCARCPGARCHVKDATAAFNRMGDMGKLPSSAWLRLWKEGGSQKILADVCRQERRPTRRADLLVERYGSVYRVGRKLATMFVSALSTPALAPGLTPWFPEVDGNELVVVDTNVARAVDDLRPAGESKTYDARASWIREQAARIDLREFRDDLPRYSPRLVQQALYAFCSKSNRLARKDRCVTASHLCSDCAPTLCPLAGMSAPRKARRTATSAEATGRCGGSNGRRSGCSVGGDSLDEPARGAPGNVRAGPVGGRQPQQTPRQVKRATEQTSLAESVGEGDEAGRL